MKKYLTLFLLFLGHFSNAQERKAKEFYKYLEKSIPKIESDSIILTIVEYGCLGSQINSSAKITNIGKLLKVNYYHQRPKDLNKYYTEYEYETVLDTSFTVERDILKRNLKEEITQIKSRPFFIEANFKITVNQKNSNKEFQFRRGDGLSNLLRYNKIWKTKSRRK